MNNFQSIQYFLPELLIVQLALSVIILDLLSLKKWVNLCVYIGFACITLLLCQLSSPNDGFSIFNGMLINDSFSSLYNWIPEFIIKLFSNDLM